MNNTAIKNATRFSFASLVAFSLALAAPRPVEAQAAPTATEPSPPVSTVAPAAAPAPTPAAPEPVVAAPPAVLLVEPSPPAPLVEEAVQVEPAPEPLPPLSVHAWGQVGLKLQGQGADTKKLNHLAQNGVLELHTDGQATKEIGLTGNIVATYATGSTGATVGLLDLIARFDIIDPFHVWAGRMLVPVDRANFSGAWFEAAWYYPGTFGSGFAGPHQGPFGRNDGLTIWGEIEGGLFKYYAGAFELDNGAKPLWTGRLNLSLINPESGYYHSSTYYGGKDLLAIGVGFQTQKNGSITNGAAAGAPPAAVDDYSELNFDILFEKNLHDAGVIDLEGAFYAFKGDGVNTDPYDWSYLLLASWLTPEAIGPGKIQPLIRWQQAKPDAGGPTESSFEGQIGYAMAAYDARIALGFQHTKVGATKGNQIYLGAQILK